MCIEADCVLVVVVVLGLLIKRDAKGNGSTEDRCSD